MTKQPEERCAQPVIPTGAYRAQPCNQLITASIHPGGAYEFTGGEIGAHIPHAFVPPAPPPAAQAGDPLLAAFIADGIVLDGPAAQASEDVCRDCGVPKGAHRYRGDDDGRGCETFKPADSRATGDGCGVCGGALVSIRGRYPHESKRNVCPTCLADRMDIIRETAARDYGVAYTDNAAAKGPK